MRVEFIPVCTLEFIYLFFFFTQMIAVTNMWFRVRITQVRPAEAGDRMPKSSSDQECLCVVVQRVSHADRYNFWENASAAGAVSCWHTNKVFCWMVNALEITPENWITLATSGRLALLPAPSRVPGLSTAEAPLREELNFSDIQYSVNERTSLYYFSILHMYIDYNHMLY